MTHCRSCREVLRMVQELHLRGYQRLRIAPSLAPSGLFWRCGITPASNTFQINGAVAAGGIGLTAYYASSMERNYFGWTDAEDVTAARLADLFVERFPVISRAGRGVDWTYAGWYVDLLHQTHPDALPYAYADNMPPGQYLRTTGGADFLISLPPPGEAEEPMGDLLV